jgi:hypothetical protein
VFRRPAHQEVAVVPGLGAGVSDSCLADSP